MNHVSYLLNFFLARRDILEHILNLALPKAYKIMPLFQPNPLLAESWRNLMTKTMELT